MHVELIGLSSDMLTHCSMHKHDIWEIVLYLKGTGTHTIGSQTYRFHPGLLICQPPGVAHGTVADTTYQDMYLAVKDFQPPAAGPVLVFEDDKENRFRTIAQLMYTTYHRQESNHAEIVQALLNAMYQLLVSWSAHRLENQHIEAGIRELVLNLSNPHFDAATLAKHSGFCAEHYRRQFKKETGTTPTAYLLNLRIEHAKQLLRQRPVSGRTIKDIAQLSGFADPYYFSRLFKARTGVYPTCFPA